MKGEWQTKARKVKAAVSRVIIAVPPTMREGTPRDHFQVTGTTGTLIVAAAMAAAATAEVQVPGPTSPIMLSAMQEIQTLQVLATITGRIGILTSKVRVILRTIWLAAEKALVDKAEWQLQQALHLHSFTAMQIAGDYSMLTFARFLMYKTCEYKW